MSRIFPIASSSSGNCTYIGYSKGGILIDAGISSKAITESLTAAAVSPQSINGIFITHEHIDHINGLKVFSKKYNIPVFASSETAAALLSLNAIENEDNLHIIDDSVTVGDFLVQRFATSHDCEGSSGYTITLPDLQKCAVCTDLGFVSNDVKKALTGCTAVLLESNHDITLLQKGSYPEYLKRRILSDKGHLSNNASASVLGDLVKNGTNRIILGHLSRENNRPELAHSAATAALIDYGMIENDDYLLFVAPPKNGKVVVF